MRFVKMGEAKKATNSSVIVFAPAGTGKTVLTRSLPHKKILFIAFEKKYRKLDEVIKDKVITYLNIDSWNDVITHQEEIEKAIASHDVVVVDSITEMRDVFIPELNFGVEVKSDKKSLYTGNIVIEIEMNGKPSALATSKSKWWVIYDGENFNWLTITNIKRCIIENKLKYVEFVGKGDTKSKKAYLIKKQMLYKYKE